MTPRELAASEWSYLGTVSIVRDPPNTPPLYVQGVNGGDSFACGLTINGNIVMRLPNESWDDMLMRVRRDPELRGDPNNEAVTLYNPHIPPKPIRQYQGNFQLHRRGW